MSPEAKLKTIIFTFMIFLHGAPRFPNDQDFRKEKDRFAWQGQSF
jgi:hypothetical protein